MKKIMTVKNVLMAMVFSVAVLGGYQAYENVSITNADSFLLENVEALAHGGDTDSTNVYCACKKNWLGSLRCKSTSKTNYMNSGTNTCGEGYNRDCTENNSTC